MEKKGSIVRRDLLQATLPTFLGIGSMRCGSTWLYEVLRCHPDTRLSESKEVQFLFMPKMLHYDLQWYEDLFRSNERGEQKSIRGEISPQYARLKAWQVGRIAKLLPDLRIILTLRHPIERLWSQTIFDLGRLQGRDVRYVGALDFLRQLERARSRLSSDYIRTVKTWTDAFGREALHIDFFDRLRTSPNDYVNDILRHIGASTPWTIPEQFIKEKVWATNSLVRHEREIPDVVRWYIADQLLKPTERLNEFLEGRVTNWVEELREIRGKARLSWRILKQINRALLSAPERLAYEAYHAALDVRFRRRWRQLETSYLSVDRSREPFEAASLNV